jgi:hypothetical protein
MQQDEVSLRGQSEETRATLSDAADLHGDLEQLRRRFVCFRQSCVTENPGITGEGGFFHLLHQPAHKGV